MDYKLKKSLETDKDWLFDLHQETMYDYVTKIYGWDFQKEREYFDDKTKMEGYHLILNRGNEKIGAINFKIKDDIIRIFRIEILSDHQNRGIGSVILDEVIEISKNENKDIELRVFKINPAHRLYLRKGFKIYKESKTHFYMRYENK